MMRPRIWVAACAALGAVSLAAPARADWTAYGGNVDKTFFTTEKLTPPMAVLWKHATNVVAEKGGNKGGPVISEGVVYFPSKNRIHAVDATTGELKWRAPEGDPNDPKIPQISATPVVNGDFVFVPDSSGTLTAYTLEEGLPAWQFKTGASIRSSPILVGNNLYFGSDDDFVYAINAQTGDLLWKSNERGNSLQLSDDPASSPVFYNGVLYLNTADMKLWAFQAETGRLIWQQRVVGPTVDISPVANNGRVYLAAGSTMYQFRLRGGQFRAYPLQQWVENDITSTPIITEKFWFFGDRDGYFHAFTSMGRPAVNTEGKPWKVRLDGKPLGTPVMTPDTIYVSTDRGFVYGIDITKGEIVWTYRTEAPKGITPAYLYYAIRAPLAASDGKLFVLGDDGTLTALSPSAADDEGPTITAPRPSKGTVMNGTPPVNISAYVWDEGSGINPDTVEVLLDGKPIDADAEAYNTKLGSAQRKGWVYDPLRRLLRYSTPKAEKGQPEVPLPNGRHRVQIQAADWKGNVSSLEWTFLVDNSLPPNTVATKPKAAGQGGAGAPGGYPGAGGGGEGSYPGGGGSGGSGGPGGQGGGQFRGRFGGYTYGNRGQGGYQFGGPGGMGPGGRGGFGGQRGGFGGQRGGFGGGRRGFGP